jgi:DNA (cytosine-5)-methyltransferase 1
LKYRITNDEIELLNAWDNLVREMLTHREGLRLPGFPLWSDLWGKKPIYEKDKKAPDWKKDFEAKNEQFYDEHKKVINSWFSNFPVVRQVNPSKRKLEWQAQNMKSLWEGLIHFRPSGIRVKRPNYVPALVAITQTTIIGPYKRRITPIEAARLQGISDSFSFGNQSDVLSYKQLGNGVAVSAVYQVIKAAVERDSEILAKTNTELLKSVRKAPKSNSKTTKEALKIKEIS